MLRHSVCGL